MSPETLPNGMREVPQDEVDKSYNSTSDGETYGVLLNSLTDDQLDDLYKRVIAERASRPAESPLPIEGREDDTNSVLGPDL